MGQSVRIPITNVFMDGDYTGQIFVGAASKQLNVILDTGSSALALDAKKYEPSHGDTTTKLAQEDSYGDGSGWTGAVIQTTVTVGSGAAPLALPQANVALAYQATANMFRGADGILGLAYAALDDAYEMAADTWATKYPATQVQTGRKTTIAPYLTELASANVTSDIVSFYTKRSQIHLGGAANDPLNQGVMIIGGGQDAKDLYTGGFQTAKVLADAWYCTNLKAILVGASTINVPARGAKGMPSNSIVDSGTNSLNLPHTLLNAIAAKLPGAWPEDAVPRGAEERARQRVEAGPPVVADHLVRPAGGHGRRHVERDAGQLLASRCGQGRRGAAGVHPWPVRALDPRASVDERVFHHLRR